jgi:hypothetical protein
MFVGLLKVMECHMDGFVDYLISKRYLMECPLWSTGNTPPYFDAKDFE